MALVELIYISYAVNRMSEEELLEILDKSRTNNQAKNITGMLLYRDRYFMQVLEGEKEVVKALYDKIAQDPRHRHVSTVQEQEISQRSFSEWSMGFHNLDKIDPLKHPGFTDFLAKPLSELETQPSHARELLLHFRERG